MGEAVAFARSGALQIGGVGFGDMCAGVERVAIGRLEYAFGHWPVGWTWCSRGSIAF
jgi:hypothetical protein